MPVGHGARVARRHAVLWAVGGITAPFLLPRLLPIDVGSLGRPEVLVLLAVPLLASLNQLEIAPRRPGRDLQEGHGLDEAGLAFVLLVLPAGTAWLLACLGYAIAQLRRSKELVKAAFNIGQWTVSLGLAALLFDRLTPAASTGLDLRIVVALVVAVAAHGAVNYLAVGAVVCTATGISWPARLQTTLRLSLFSLTGNMLLGMAAAALYLQEPWLVVTVAGLGVVVKNGYRALATAGERFDEVRIEHDRLDRIIRDALNGIVLLDHDCRVAVWNPAMADLTGIPAAEAVGQRATDLLDGRLRDPQDGSAPRPLSEVLVDGTVEVVLEHGRGELRTVAITHEVQHDRVDHIVGHLLQVQDLTAEREAARLKDDFLARVTHELRTPLTSIVGFGKTLQVRGDELPAAMRDDLQARLVRAGEQMERLVDDLLLVAVGTGASGRGPRELRTLDVAPHVRKAVELELAEHGGRFVDVTVLQDTHAVADPDWLATTVRHLICNGLKYSDDLSPVHVEVDHDGDHALIRVRDEGRGIPPSKINRMFDRFARVEDPLRMETRGAGLGLFIVDRLVARMGGHVKVDSTLGVGSTFEVRLPVASPERPPVLESASAHT